jgi:hypothetical protein
MEKIVTQDVEIWVLASERLPPMESFVYVKDSNGGKRLGNFFCVEGGEVVKH